MGTGKTKVTKSTPTVAEELQKSTLTWDAASFGRQIVENQQYYLMRNMKEIEGFNENYYPKNQHAGPWHTPGRKMPKFQTQYKSFIPIESTKKLEPMKVFTKIAGAQRSDINTMMNLTSAQQALLVPTLRLYKLHYTVDMATGKPDTTKKPIEKEIIFDDYTVGSSPDLIHLHKQGKLAGSGIKSFRWALKGVNPAEVDRNIEAELVIFFNNVSDVFVDAEGIPTTHAGQQQASFLDLIIHSIPKEEIEKVGKDKFCPDTVYDGAFFELKAVVGWASPVIHGSKGRAMAPFNRTELEAIENSQQTMYLQLTKHKFNFNMDGSATLTINYRARYTYKDAKYDILGVDGIEGLNQQIKEAEVRIKKMSERQGVSAEALDLYREGQMGPLNEQRLKMLKDRYNQIFKQLAPYRHFITVSAAELGIYDATGKGAAVGKEQLGEFLKGKKKVKKVNILTPETQQKMELETSADVAQSPEALKYLKGVASSLGPADQSLPLPKDAATAMPGAGAGLTTEDWLRKGLDMKGKYATETELQLEAYSSVEISEEYGGVMQGFKSKGTLEGELGTTRLGYKAKHTQVQGTGLVGLTGEFDIAYFYFGDILEAMIMGNSEFYGLLNNRLMGIVLTDAQYLDPKTTQAEVSKLLKGDEPQTYRAGIGSSMWKCGFRRLTRQQQLSLVRTIPIANIPIHFAEFYSWFVRKVVKPARDVYFFEEFIADLITDFVAPALSGASFGTYMPAMQVNLSYVGIEVNAGSRFAENTYGKKITPGSTEPATGYSIGRLISDKMIPLEQTPAGRPYRGDQSKRSAHTTYKFLFVSTLLTAQLTGDMLADKNAGILHFTIGEPTGLLKSATFDRVDQPYLREARVDRTRAMSAEQLRELYNVTLRLYGTTLLKPGQLIYVVPNEMTFGDPTTEGSVARLLGIGGYHLVTSVDSRITEQGYETTIKALHQALPGTEPK